MPRYKVTIARMGTSNIFLRSFLEELGFEPLLPPPITQETLSLGSRYTPEFACLPLKVNLGNYLQTLETQDPDLIFMAGGIGPCRFGLYGEVQKEILRSLGYDLPFIVIEPPKKHFTEVIQNFTRFLGGKFWRNLPRAIRICWCKAKVTDVLDKMTLSLAPHLSVEWRKELWRKRDEFLIAIDQTGKTGCLKAILAEAEEVFASFPQEPRADVFRVMVVGEIYTVLEPAVNFQVERRLSLMGIEVTRTIYISEWIWQQIILNFLRIDWQKSLREEAKPYLSRFIGGHGLETVAYTVRAARRHYDGVVQLAPLGCMPEVAAMSIIGQVSKERQIPVLSLLMDEHTAEAGALTRIEAFVDLIQNRKARTSSGLGSRARS